MNLVNRFKFNPTTTIYFIDGYNKKYFWQFQHLFSLKRDSFHKFSQKKSAWEETEK